MSQKSTDPSVYNDMYLRDDRTYDDPKRSPYMAMYKAIVAEVSRRGIQRVLEVGCGSGTLAGMLIGELDVGYLGFDFAEAAAWPFGQAIGSRSVAERKWLRINWHWDAVKTGTGARKP
jgi:cyclopropane fatty-acyl-phospholipid synthase-like methyltransferase